MRSVILECLVLAPYPDKRAGKVLYREKSTIRSFYIGAKCDVAKKAEHVKGALDAPDAVWSSMTSFEEHDKSRWALSNRHIELPLEEIIGFCTDYVDAEVCS
jgi:hypothetical protein